MSSEKILVVDGNSILNRAFYGLSKTAMLTTADGLYTNAVFGFLNILQKFLNEEKPKYVCVAFDLKAPTFRHIEYEQYKAHRKGMPDELRVQVPLVKELLDALSIARVEIEGFEADDILGTVSLNAQKQGIEAVLLTGDRDSLQLASDTTRIKLPVTRGSQTETEEYDVARILEKYGVSPNQLIDVKGLMGDTSDNIPGVPGIGEKTALSLIQKFGSIEALYENIDQVDKKGVREKLLANKELAQTSKRLATIHREIDNLHNFDVFLSKEYDKQKLYACFKKLEFKSLIEKYGLSDVPVAQTAESLKTEHINITDISELESYTSAIKESSKMAVYYNVCANGIMDTLSIFTCSDDYAPAIINFSDKLSWVQALGVLREVFEDSNIKIYGHDVKKLIKFLKINGINPQGIEFDTMIGGYLMDPTRSTYTLAQLAEEYAKMEIVPLELLFDKHGARLPNEQQNSADNILAAGVTAIYNLALRLGEIIDNNGQHQLYYDIELPLVEVLADMELHGFRVDVESLRAFSAELDKMLVLLENEIYMLSGEEFNINSPKQLGVVLFEKLNLPVIKKTKTGYSTDAEVLEQLSYKHEVVERILEYRQLTKLKSTYAEGLLNVINPETHKIHSSFNQTVTATGRISSTEPNLQNIPIKLELGRKIRKVFIPTNDEYLLLDADYSQIELRVLAHITSDPNMIAAFVNNEDIHTTTASKVFGLKPEEVTPLMRSRAKAVNFGIVYGISDFSLSKDIGVTKKEAKKYIDDYLEKYRNVREYMHDIVRDGKENGFVTTLFNRRRYLPELKSSNFNVRSFGERVAMNTPIQGSAADIIKISMVKVYTELKKRNLKSRLILQVHDELIIETHRDEQQEVSALLKDCMENAVSLKVPLLVEVKSGETWYETK